MFRIKKAFEKKGKIAYLTAGDGDTVQCFLSLIRGGANILEIGIPFSDPIADGPVIQRAMKRALEHHTSLDDVIRIIQELRSKTDIPMIVFTYFNPICHAPSFFLKRLKEAGADGILVVDLPLEESDAFQQECRNQQLALIPVAAPSTPLSRFPSLVRLGSGFLYYACRKGTTGIKEVLPDDIMQRIKEIRSVTHLPIVAGFGIANQESVRSVLRAADGCVVGSYFVRAIENKCSPDELEKIAKEIFV